MSTTLSEIRRSRYAYLAQGHKLEFGMNSDVRARTNDMWVHCSRVLGCSIPPQWVSWGNMMWAFNKRTVDRTTVVLCGRNKKLSRVAARISQCVRRFSVIDGAYIEFYHSRQGYALVNALFDPWTHGTGVLFECTHRPRSSLGYLMKPRIKEFLNSVKRIAAAK